MNIQRIKQQLGTLSLSMFRKDFFGIYHGSISARVESNLFVINHKEAIFDDINENSLVELYFNKDYRWKKASLDAEIHKEIYQQHSDAKFISFTMPPFTVAYSLMHNVISPLDYFGKKEFPAIYVYDPKEFDDWYDRATTAISQYFSHSQSNIIVIKGYGVYAYNRDLHEMAKQLAILEKSCRLLMLNSKTAALDIDN
ncbi:MAG: class II aldolase and adducin N-terminal domain-containing protein [Campylobacterota bacterium]|nr:class II aldolase and adducin N-terminal domain-containing protein [Campylobacterota bacterium]